ncbi:MAG: fructosamine kinase family protein [Chloroflexi bacterium]|nr:fructosamine kinase family protein [Chloroflexota bacterium]
MNVDVRALIETVVQTHLTNISPLSGGCIGQVYRVELSTGEQLVAKVDNNSNPKLAIEGYMLRYLRAQSELPVPQIIHADDRLLIMTYLSGDSRFSAEAEAHAAELLAELHTHDAPAFGLEQDTLIGGLHQPNPWSESWIDFFSAHRLMFMAGEGVKNGRLPSQVQSRIGKFCERLDRWISEPERPSLIHGDVWTTNVLAAGNQITGFVDPAIYYADPEIELAFTTLFGTFGDPFFSRYHELRPIRPGFFEERRDIYNLYPLLVHVRLFGGSYVHSVDQTLRRFGF